MPRDIVVTLRMTQAEAERILGFARCRLGKQVRPAQALIQLALDAAEMHGRLVRSASSALTLADIYRLLYAIRVLSRGPAARLTMPELAGYWIRDPNREPLESPGRNFEVRTSRLGAPEAEALVTHLSGLLADQVADMPNEFWVFNDLRPEADQSKVRLEPLLESGLAPRCTGWPAMVRSYPSAEEWWAEDPRRRPGAHGGSGGGPTFGYDWNTPEGRYLIEWIDATDEITAFRSDHQAVHVIGTASNRNWMWGLDPEHRERELPDRQPHPAFWLVRAYEREMRIPGVIYELAHELGHVAPVRPPYVLVP